MTAKVISVSADAGHRFGKPVVASIEIVKGLGVRGDAHCGETVKHRSRVRADPTQPNLRQVHLLHAELLAELQGSGFRVAPGEMGENVTTQGLHLLGLPTGTLLKLGAAALVEITGLRNPCAQIDVFRPGLLKAVLGRDEHGNLVRKAGVMAIVLGSGTVRPGDPVTVTLPPFPHRPLERV